MKRGPSKEGLMFLTDPKETLQALCFFMDNKLNKKEYIKKYEEIKNRKSSIHKKNADIHFYTLSLFKLIEKSDKSQYVYQMTPIARELCSLMGDESKIEHFQELLSKILLTNEYKGELFSNFLDFTKDGKTIDEIAEKFRIRPSKTMVAWCKLAGLIIEDHNNYQSLNIYLEDPDIFSFKQCLENYYHELQNSEIFGIKRIFVPIDKLRINVGIKLGISPEKFNKLLKELLDSDYGDQFSLHGGTTQLYEEKKKEVFKYKNKIYLFISMK